MLFRDSCITHFILHVSLVNVQILHILTLSRSIPYFHAMMSLAQQLPVLSLCLPLLLCRAVLAVSEETEQEAKHVWCAPLRHIANGLWILTEEKELECYLPNYFLLFHSHLDISGTKYFLCFLFMLLCCSFSFCFCAHRLSSNVRSFTPGSPKWMSWEIDAHIRLRFYLPPKVIHE